MTHNRNDARLEYPNINHKNCLKNGEREIETAAFSQDCKKYQDWLLSGNIVQWLIGNVFGSNLHHCFLSMYYMVYSSCCYFPILWNRGILPSGRTRGQKKHTTVRRTPDPWAKSMNLRLPPNSVSCYFASRWRHPLKTALVSVKDSTVMIWPKLQYYIVTKGLAAFCSSGAFTLGRHRKPDDVVKEHKKKATLVWVALLLTVAGCEEHTNVSRICSPLKCTVS